jgi:hypothetical protein
VTAVVVGLSEYKADRRVAKATHAARYLSVDEAHDRAEQACVHIALFYKRSNTVEGQPADAAVWLFSNPLIERWQIVQAMDVLGGLAEAEAKAAEGGHPHQVARAANVGDAVDGAIFDLTVLLAARDRARKAAP